MLVSVIIPCYNVEAYISECIDSVLKQTYSPIEIICVDNNSTDTTLQLLNTISSKNPGKITVLQELKKGAPAARNKGILVAKGEWLQFLDADDLLFPEKIEHQISLVNENKNAAFVAAAFIKQSVNGIKTTHELDELDPLKAVFSTKLGITSANLFNASKVVAIGNWDEKLKSSQEADLMFRLLKKDLPIAFDTTPKTVIRERDSGQISQRNPEEKWLHYIQLRLDILNFLKTERSDYFMVEKKYYHNYLFSLIRILAQHNIELADTILQNNFEKNFISGNELPFSYYKILFKLFGFKKAERLKKQLKF